MDLFNQMETQVPRPLADRLRPQTLQDMVGQKQVFANHAGFFEQIGKGQMQSLILWGPPGCGKTSFAMALLNETPGDFYHENAIDLGTKRIREIGEKARHQLLQSQRKTLVFVDEIHRLNRGQQDVLLPFVEKGYFYLIGATTENPSYELNAALMSRCRLLVFESLTSNDLKSLVYKALSQLSLKTSDLFQGESMDLFVEQSHGDGRRLLNTLEEVVFRFQQNPQDFPITEHGLNQIFQGSGLRFDKKGDEHYDTISAFIKSIRGSDPDAGVYYLARLLEGGEDPLFIARRMVILASEDIGNADPNALTMALNVFKAVEVIGLPEARINLSQAVTYLCCAPKSNRSYEAINKAQAEVKKSGPLPIPKSLRSASTSLMKQIGYGENYQYSHQGATGWLPQDYFPENLKKRSFYTPSSRGFEKRMGDYLAWMRGEKNKAKDSD